MAWKFNPFTGALDYTTDVPVSIANGGTGQSTAAAAFNALAPTTTRGDVIARGASGNIRIPAGTSGQMLQTQGTGADAVFANVPAFDLAFQAAGTGGFSPATSTTYYFSAIGLTNAPLTADTLSQPVAVACTLRAVSLMFICTGTKSTSQFSVWADYNYGTTNTLLTSTMSFTNIANAVNVSGLSQAANVGDVFSIKFTTPSAWAPAAPTQTFYLATLHFTVP